LKLILINGKHTVTSFAAIATAYRGLGLPVCGLPEQVVAMTDTFLHGT